MLQIVREVYNEIYSCRLELPAISEYVYIVHTSKLQSNVHRLVFTNVADYATIVYG